MGSMVRRRTGRGIEIGCIIVFSLSFMLVGGLTEIRAEDEANLELPPPATVEETLSPMDMTFYEWVRRRPITSWFKEKTKDLPPFISDMRLNLQLRTLYFFQQNLDNSYNEAWAGGGGLDYQSGWFCDRFAAGATLYTSQPLYAPDSRDGTKLLATGQEGYTVLGQLYGKLKLFDHNEVRFYRQSYDSPYINKYDSLMTPNTFEGYSVHGALGEEKTGPGFMYAAGYVPKIKERNSDEFVSMSKAAGANVERGTVVAGGRFTYGDSSIGAIEYFTPDILNIFYAEAKHVWKVTDDLGFYFSTQFSHQQSAGDNLLTGSTFYTYQVGFWGEVGYRNGILSFAYTKNNDGADLRYPWSSYPGFTSVQIRYFNRANEQAFMIRASYDWKRFIPGLTTYALYTVGNGRKDPLAGQSVPNENEIDVDIQYRITKGIGDGLWLRLRYAHTTEEGGRTADQVRVIINLPISFL
jgi:hypothetical protein